MVWRLNQAAVAAAVVDALAVAAAAAVTAVAFIDAPFSLPWLTGVCRTFVQRGFPSIFVVCRLNHTILAAGFDGLAIVAAAAAAAVADFAEEEMLLVLSYRLLRGRCWYN